MMHMHGFMGKCHRWLHNKGVGLLLLRLALGSFFLVHGIAKASDMSATTTLFAGWGFASYWAYAETIAELISGLAIVVGAFLWIAAPLIVISMAVAVFKVILPSLSLQQATVIQSFLFGWGPLAIYAFAAVALAYTGPGRYSLAAWWMRRHHFDKCAGCKDVHGMKSSCADCDTHHAIHTAPAPEEPVL